MLLLLCYNIIFLHTKKCSFFAHEKMFKNVQPKNIAVLQPTVLNTTAFSSLLSVAHLSQAAESWLPFGELFLPPIA